MSCTTKTVVAAGGTITFLARVRDGSGAEIQQADIDTIKVFLFEVTDDGLSPVDANGDGTDEGDYIDAPDAADVVFDDIQTDPIWSQDSTGFNLSYSFTVPNVRDTEYEVRLKLTSTGGDVLIPRWTFTTI